VAERTREIGIRMVLGATSGAVMREVLRRTIALAATGVALGAAGAFAATRVLSKLLFEVKPADPMTFAAVAILLAAVAILAGWIAARRATRVDPMVALRYE
jgi:putative ABC transport system permease protein